MGAFGWEATSGTAELLKGRAGDASTRLTGDAEFTPARPEGFE